MGYYSDIRFNTTAAGYKEFLAALPDEFKDPTKWGLFDKHGNPEVFEEYDGGVMFGWDGVKWYTDWGTYLYGNNPFADVQAVMAAFNEVLDNGVPIEYIRVGEETGDIEYGGDIHYASTEGPTCYLGTSTTIELY